MIILSVGLSQRKGTDVLIKALPLVLKEAPEARLVIVGSGPRPAGVFIDLAKSLGVLEKIEFLHNISNEQLTKLYQQCAVFALTSRYTDNVFEGYGLVFFEAGLYKKPVVGSRSGGIPEAVIDGQTGLLVPENNPQATAQAIIKILKDKELAQRLGENNYRLAKERNWDNYIKEVIKIYEQFS